MSFTLKIKKEILNQEYSKSQAHDFISGLVASSAIKTKTQSYLIKIRNYEVASTIKDMFWQLNLNYNQSKINKNYIILNDFVPNRNVKHPHNFFSGIFVGGGSVSNPLSTSYHLELQFFDSLLASKVCRFLNAYDFNFNEIKRRNNWVLYIKKSEMITDFIRVMQAFRSLIDFENVRINRDFRNQLNRYSNLDAYNQKKLARASNNFKMMYEFLKAQNIIYYFNEKETTFFELKFNNLYSSLAELTIKYEQKTGIQKTRAGLNHYLYKLKKIYLEHSRK